jgi:DNA-binding MarR family transcriptional regulator
MKVVQEKIKTNKIAEYYKKNLEILNCILENKLTKVEMDTLAMFLMLPKEVVEDGYFTSHTKKIVIETNNISSSSLSGILKSIISKGIITKKENTGKLELSPKFLIEGKQGYQIMVYLEHED